MRLTKDLEIGNDMNKYIIPLLKQHQGNKCVRCNDELERCEIHHKHYGLDINIYDLEFLCLECHGKEHGKKRNK